MPDKKPAPRRKATPKPQPVQQPLRCATLDDVKAITQQDTETFTREIFTYVSEQKPSNDQYIEWLLGRINTEPAFKAWATIIIYKMTTIR